MNNVTNLGPHLGKSKIAREGYNSSQILLLRQTQNALALMGLLCISSAAEGELYAGISIFIWTDVEVVG